MILNCVYITAFRGIFRGWLMGPTKRDCLLLIEGATLADITEYIGGRYAGRVVRYAENVRVG